MICEAIIKNDVKMFQEHFFDQFCELSKDKVFNVRLFLANATKNIIHNDETEDLDKSSMKPRKDSDDFMLRKISNASSQGDPEENPEDRILIQHNADILLDQSQFRKMCIRLSVDHDNEIKSIMSFYGNQKRGSSTQVTQSFGGSELSSVQDDEDQEEKVSIDGDQDLINELSGEVKQEEESGAEEEPQVVIVNSQPEEEEESGQQESTSESPSE